MNGTARSGTKKSGKNNGGVLFGLLFLFGGLVPAYFATLQPLYLHLSSGEWIVVPARIENLTLHTSQGDSQTYSVHGAYSYYYQGRRYRSEQISFYSGNDNIGDYWQSLYQRLNTQRQSDTVSAWVNPQQPADAYLDRTLRYAMLAFGLVFLLVFGGVGSTILYLSLRRDPASAPAAAPGLRAESAGAVQAPAAAGIASTERHASSVMIGIGVVFLLISLPLAAVIRQALTQGEWAILLFLLFPVVGTGLLWSGWRARQLFRLIGRTPLFQDPNPGCSGGQAGGYFDLLQGQFRHPPRAQLRCCHRYSTGSGKNRTTHTDVLWQSEQPALLHGRRVYLQFDVPAGYPGSGQAEGYRGDIDWQLSCEGELQTAVRQRDGLQVVPFARSWTLWVEQGQASASWQPDEAERQYRREQQQQQVEESAAGQIGLQQSGHELVLHSRAGRHKGIGIGLLLAGLAFTAVGGGMVLVAGNEGGMLWAFPVLFTPVGLLLLGLGLKWLGSSLQTRIRRGEVQVQRSLFGRPGRQQQAPVSQAEQISLHSVMSATVNGRQTDYYSIRAETPAATLVLVEGIAGRDEALQIRQRILDALDTERFGR